MIAGWGIAVATKPNRRGFEKHWGSDKPMSPGTGRIRRLGRICIAAWLGAQSGCGVVDTSLLPMEDGVAPPITDTDKDSLADVREMALGTNPLDPDTDGDGIPDGYEMSGFTSPLVWDSDGDGIADGELDVLGSPTARSQSTSTGNDVEPNDAFELAVVLDSVGTGVMTFEGRVDRVGDVDVYALGGLAAGDRLIINLLRVDEAFRPSLAFCDNGLIVGVVNDYYADTTIDVPGFMDTVVQQASGYYYLAVSHQCEEPVLGAYRLDITVVPGGGVGAIDQTVLLEFGGGTLSRTLFGVLNVDAFNPAVIAPDYAGLGEEIKRAILATLEENYAGFDVNFVTSDDVWRPPVGEFSTLYFGSSHDALLGASVKVDAFNRDHRDDGVIFTESFVPSLFGPVPTPAVLGTAIGNVASHELGHLLGLNHVRGDGILMDERANGPDLTADRDFGTAPVSESVYPIGEQDAQRLLAWTVGTR